MTAEHGFKMLPGHSAGDRWPLILPRLRWEPLAERTGGLSDRHAGLLLWQQARAFETAGDWLAAAQAYEKGLSAWPDCPWALGFAQALLKLGEPRLALELCQWVQSRPVPNGVPRDSIATLQARALIALGQAAQAEQVLQAALAGGWAGPHAVTLWSQAKERNGLVDLARGGYALALQALQAALPPLSPGYAGWHSEDLLEWGLANERCGHHLEAAQAFARAGELEPQQCLPPYREGKAWMQLGQKPRAIQALRRTLALGSPSDGAVLGMLGMLEAECLDWESSRQHLEQLVSLARQGQADQPLELAPYVAATLIADPEVQKLISDRQAAYFKSRWAEHRIKSLPLKNREVRRLGYLSSDFCNHATSALIAEVLERHDRHQFEVFLVSNSPDDGSAMAQRIRRSGNQWVDVRGQSALQLVQTLRELDLDILVDLKGATQDGHPEVFAMRCAPIQVSWLGFPGTMGEGLCDYVLGDPVVTPYGNQRHFSERILQMPLCYQPNDSRRPRPEPALRSDWGFVDDDLVLCAHHQPFKINQEVFWTWCEILRQVPRAKLWLLRWNPQVEPRLRAQAQAQGIAPSRLVFCDKAEVPTHLARIACADLYLDTWPCNAHTTASESLWMGVPLVTLCGESFAQRVGASLLAAVGLHEAIQSSPQAYIDWVAAWSRCPDQRDLMCSRLRSHHSQLFDGHAFARQFERILKALLPDGIDQAHGHCPDEALFPSQIHAQRPSGQEMK